MTLIHTALLVEARAIIDKFKLKKVETYQYKIFQNKDIVLIVSGIGGKNTKLALEYIVSRYKIEKVFNIGIAGCKDTTIPIGELFCINQKLKNIKTTTLTTCDKPINDKSQINTTLVDMEGKYFLEFFKDRLDNNQIYLLKIVSDYLDITIPKKSFIISLINKNIKQIQEIL